MKAILIDVHTQSVTEVEHDNTLDNIYDLLNCRTFDVVRIDEVDSIYVDDEGLFVDDQLFFEYGGDAQSVRLAGNGLILGVDDEGNSISPQTTVEEVEGRVGFLPRGYSW
jgi:hypothetical protein|tara:strand:- start:1443 stop:1772 length:330 start_codon:yes stop_codon:yes gene_type:complete